MLKIIKDLNGWTLKKDQNGLLPKLKIFVLKIEYQK